ncbi:MAG TPA: CARDB domain-containing protein [Gaiellaceae bacterium]|nr:CARDB domain-containing protein [Gaiellaceae bacterium]
MDPPDDDIQFDFFDEELPTADAAPRERGRVPRMGRKPRGPAGEGRPVKPLVRLLLLVGSVIFLVLVFSLLIASCAGESKHDLYGNYMDKVTTVANQSTTDGENTVKALTTPGLGAAAIVKKLQQIAAQEQQNISSAQGLNPPGKLRGEHLDLIEALQLRVSGVDGLAKALQKTVGSKVKASAAAVDLSQQAYRLLASDVVWEDLFQGPSQTVLDQEGVHGVTVPQSRFLAAPDDVITAHAMAQILQRISNASGSTPPAGLHGTNISTVAALPNGQGGTSEVLTEGQLNTVTTSSSLVFQVTIHNGGISQEVQVPVTLTINRPSAQGGPIVKTEKVQLIDPGTDQSVLFSDLGQVPFASQTKVIVDVAKVPGETNLTNNHAEYNVIFSLPS